METCFASVTVKIKSAEIVYAILELFCLGKIFTVVWFEMVENR